MADRNSAKEEGPHMNEHCDGRDEHRRSKGKVGYLLELVVAEEPHVPVAALDSSVRTEKSAATIARPFGRH